MSSSRIHHDCPSHRNRRPEVEKQDTLKRSVSVPHLNDQVRATPRSTARRRANDGQESKTKPAKPALKSSAPKKLNKVKEASVNFRDTQYSTSSDHKSEPNGFDLNELLKILQEEYTKLVL